MPLALQPPFVVLPAYRPVKFTVYVTQPAATPAENAVVQIYKNGSLIATVKYKSFFNQVGFSPPQVDYYFNIDIQKYVQDSLGPDTGAPKSLVQNNFVIDNTDFYADYHIEITYERISTAGILEAVPAVSDTSNTYTIFSASRKHQEIKFLYDYVGNVAPYTQTKFLTKQNLSFLPTCKDENLYLSFIQKNSVLPYAGLRVQLLNSSLAVLYDALAQTFLTTGFKQASLNVGFDVLATKTYVQGAPNFNDPLIKYYAVSFGEMVLVGPTWVHTDKTETAVYKIKNSCCSLRDLKLHFINMLGGLDSYTFNSEKELNLKAESTAAKKALNYTAGTSAPDLTTDSGSFKTKSTGSNSYKVKSRFLTNEKAAWLSELLTSPKVYAEIDGDFVPVIIQNKEQKTFSQAGKIRFEIVVKLANDLIIQRI
tara:strand:+ start:3175 stop:4446 length:1272 start_codon:yes stop_codon:yes gene_type:complete